jgi:hypothetical protein
MCVLQDFISTLEADDNGFTRDHGCVLDGAGFFSYEVVCHVSLFFVEDVTDVLDIVHHHSLITLQHFKS